MTSEAQKRAARKYLAKKKSISVRLDPEIADVMERKANERGESVNSFVESAILSFLVDLERDNKTKKEIAFHIFEKAKEAQEENRKV